MSGNPWLGYGGQKIKQGFEDRLCLNVDLLRMGEMQSSPQEARDGLK
jgi:hypothetical protein